MCDEIAERIDVYLAQRNCVSPGAKELAAIAEIVREHSSRVARMVREAVAKDIGNHLSDHGHAEAAQVVLDHYLAGN